MKPLKPVMAALLAASSFAFVPARTAVANDAQMADAVARERAVSHDKLFVARLIALVESSGQVRADIGERLAKFIQGKEKDKQYLTDGLLGDAVQLKGAVAVAKSWPERNKGEPGMVAALYYVMGMESDQLPAWAPADYKDEFKPNPEWSGRLAAALSGQGWSTSKQVAQSDAANGTIALLNDAAKRAQIILDDARTRGEIHGSIVAHDTTEPKLPTVKGTRNPLSSDAGAGFDDFYVHGAEVRDVWGPGDDGYRTLSTKIYSIRNADGSITTNMGIVDITAGDIQTPSLPFPVDISRPGTTDVVLRDGGRHYIVTVDEQGGVTLKREGGSDGDRQGSLVTSVQTLEKDRNEQIVGSGVVMIGGEPFYVLGQGGARGSYLFFSQAQMDAAPYNPHPELMGDVTKVTKDGNSVPMPYKDGIMLGHLPEPDGAAWRLEYNSETHVWFAVQGEGDKPVVAAKTTPTGPALAALVKTHAGWTEGDGNDTISADMRDRFKIMKDPKGLSYVISPDLPPDFALHLTGDPDMRAFEKYVVVVTKAGDVTYYDLPALAEILAKGKPTASGQYLKKSNEMRDAKDIGVANDILHTYMNKTVDLKPGVAKYAAKGPYSISAGSPGGKFAVRIDNEKQDCEIYPELGAKCTDATGATPSSKSPDQAADLDAAAKPYAGCVSVEESNNKKRTLYTGPEASKLSAGVKDDDVCLYQMTDENKSPQYSLTLDFKTAAGPAKRVAYLFGGDLSKPAQFTYKSLGADAVKNPASQPIGISKVFGSTTARGVYGLFLTGEQSPLSGAAAGLKNKAANCVGPVVWWGMKSEEDALKACQEGRFADEEESWWHFW